LALSVEEVSFANRGHTEELIADAVPWTIFIPLTDPCKLTTTLNAVLRGDTVIISEAAKAASYLAVGTGVGAISITDTGSAEETGAQRSTALGA